MILRIVTSITLLSGFIVLKPENLAEPAFSGVVKFFEYALCYAIVAFDIVKDAVKNLFGRRFLDENFLMTIATFGAFGVGEYPEAVMVMVLYQIGEVFHGFAVKKSRKSITDLMKIKPEFANVEEGGNIVRKAPKDVKTGEIIVVCPGEKIPLDGVVVEGFSSIDTSNLTGESVPRELAEGREAVSGCISLDGVLKIKVTKEFKDSTVTKILDMVENAANKKAKAEKFITKFAKIYTPLVVAAAILLALVPPLFLGDFLLWFKRALIFLVISCPCALVISIPLGFFAGVGAASKKGILIKGSSSLETLSGAKTFVFDKTGTLTLGKFSVTDVIPAGQKADRDELLKFAAYAEIFSTHPVAESVKTAYRALGGTLDPSFASDLKEYPGFGVVAKVFEKTVIAGNARIMEMFNIEYKKENAAGTVVYVAIDSEYAGCILISDTPKANAKEALLNLKKAANSPFAPAKTVMLTGDRENAAREIRRALDIDEIYFNLLPNDKVEILERLIVAQKAGGAVVFIGDGINDAPVLTRADVGISMGKMGSDAAIEASDVVIMDDNLEKIAMAVKISKKTLQIVKQNIVFALGIKALFLVLGAFGMVSMWGAVFADVGVSALAVLNSLRMLYTRRV